MRDHALEVAALLDELEAVDGADPLDAVAVVAAEEDAEVDELVVGEVEADERRLQADVGDLGIDCCFFCGVVFFFAAIARISSKLTISNAANL